MSGESRSAIRRRYDREAERYDRRWSSYIHRSVERTLNRMELAGSERILDVGCGTGALLAAILERHPNAHLTGLDLSPAMLAAARRTLGGQARLVQGTVERLPFCDASFDRVVSSSSLHHWRWPVAALRELLRVVDPPGQIVLTDWCADFLTCRLLHRWLRMFDRAYNRSYGADALVRMLTEVGLEDTRAERFRIGWCWGMMTAWGRARRGSAGPA